MGRSVRFEDSLRLGQDYEPEALLVSALSALCVQHDLVPIADIRDHVRKESNWQPTAWAVANMVRDMGFETRKAHGQVKAVVDRPLLAELAQK
jgi:hypothetical protein